MPHTDPDILRILEEERGAMQGNRNYRTLTLDSGEKASVRFLPVQMGPRKTFFARIARHWVNRKPIFCPKNSSPDFGGDPQYPCPMCALVDEVYSQGRPDYIDQVKRMISFPKILTYVFVFSITNERGMKMESPPNELYVPNEYWFGKDNFDDFIEMYRSSLAKLPDFGFLDPVDGNDFTISRKATRYSLIREDSQPLEQGKTVDELLAIIDDAFAKVRLPDHTPLSDEEMDAEVEKAADFVYNASPRSRGGSRDDRNEEESGRGSRGGSEQRTESRGAPRGSTRSEPPAREVRSAPRSEAPPSRGEPPARGGGGRAAPSREAPARETPTRTASPVAQPRRTAAPPVESNVEAELDEQPPPDLPAEGATAVPSRRAISEPPARRTGTATTGKIEENPEELAPEKHDYAPPEPAANAAPAQPERASRATAAGQTLSSNIRGRLSRLGSAPL